jgi:aryl-alcohol dehydrogenase-like predicted oxidoreductase
VKYTRLGHAGMKVSVLCLGTMIYGQQVDESTSIKIIQRALDLGINFIDTADVYVYGRSEEIVGNAIRGCRDDVVLATKVYNRMGPGPNDEGLSRKHIQHAIRASLLRLATTHVDLYQVHRFDAQTPLHETLSTMTTLRREGWIHYFGCSNFAAWQIERALRVSDRYGFIAISSSQPIYNILHRDVERELLPLCHEEGIGVIPYSPLAGGFLTGKYQIDQPAPPASRGQLRPEWMQQYHTEHNYRVLQELRQLSEETGLKMSQLSLAWILANNTVTAPIIGASRITQLEENVEVVDHPPSAKVLARISEVSKPEWLQRREAREARTHAFLKDRIQYWQNQQTIRARASEE